MESTKPKVLLDPHFRTMEPLFKPDYLAEMRSFADVVWARSEPISEEELTAVQGELEAIVCGHWRHGPVSRYPKLRAIFEVGGSFPRPDVLDYPECFARGIRVLSCAPGFAPAVAEMSLGLAIGAARGIVAQDAAFRKGDETWGTRGYVHDFMLFEKTVGFIGFGNLARHLQRLLQPFRCPILAYDPWLTDGHLRTLGVTPAGLDELIERSKVIFVLAVPSVGNRALLDREKLEKIQPHALLVLMSRAHLVDFDALTELVTAGRFLAAIDVFPAEPLPADHPIRNAPNTILSPHRAGGGPETYRHIGRMVLNDLEAVLKGLPTQEMQVAQPEYIRQRGSVKP